MKQQFFLFCGILSSLLYVALNVIIPMQYEGYNSASQTVSELSAIGAPTRMVWVWWSLLYTLLVIAFGWGVLRSAKANRPLLIAGMLIFICGFVSLIWPMAPMHQREFLATLAPGEQTVTDTMHLVMASITVLLWTVAMGFGAAAFGRSFRIYSILTIIMLLVFGGLTALDAPRVKANLPTPLTGVWERINIGVFLLWVIVLAVILLKKEKR